jgi:hypothetical protein
VNPYAKIALKIGIVIAICIVILFGYRAVWHKQYVAKLAKVHRDTNMLTVAEQSLDALLAYKPLLPQIRQVQLQDMQMIRNLIPDSDEFVLTSYLRRIHTLISDNHLETSGISIRGAAAQGTTTFDEAFPQDPAGLVADLASFMEALDTFQQRMDEMNNFLVSYQFYNKVASGSENFEAIAGGIETHTFTLSVRGSYKDIKKFTFEVFNMRPLTALTNFQMAPQGEGFGPTRQYLASFKLITYGDANGQPQLWDAYRRGLVGSETPDVEVAEATDSTSEDDGSDG